MNPENSEFKDRSKVLRIDKQQKMSKNVNWAPTRVGLSLKQVNRNYHYSKIVCRTSPPKINID